MPMVCTRHKKVSPLTNYAMYLYTKYKCPTSQKTQNIDFSLHTIKNLSVKSHLFVSLGDLGFRGLRIGFG